MLTLVAGVTCSPFSQCVRRSLAALPLKSDHSLEPRNPFVRWGAAPSPFSWSRDPWNPGAACTALPSWSSLSLNSAGFLFSVGQDWPTLGTSLWPLPVCPCASCHLGAPVWPRFLFRETSPLRAGGIGRVVGESRHQVARCCWFLPVLLQDTVAGCVSNAKSMVSFALISYALDVLKSLFN